VKDGRWRCQDFSNLGSGAIFDIRLSRFSPIYFQTGSVQKLQKKKKCEIWVAFNVTTISHFCLL